MNSKHTPKFKALLALFLSISMLFSMVVTSFAALPQDVVDENGLPGEDGVIRYVSIGDSVTNGYGLDGYYYVNGNKEINSNGYKRVVETAYPNRVVEILKGEGLNVELTQLAMSSMRYSDLRMILDDDFHGDSHLGDSENGGIGYLRGAYNRYIETVKGTNPGYSNAEVEKKLRAEYTEAIASADLISIDLGSNDFGTYLTSRLMDIVSGNPENLFDNSFNVHLDESDANSLVGLLHSFIVEATGNSGDEMSLIMEGLSQTLLYGLVAFCTNFDAVMELIYEINPDAQVMIIDVYNMMAGVELSDGTVKDAYDNILKPGLFQGAPVSEVYDTFVDIANLYVRELSPWANKVVHVNLDKVNDDLFPDLVMDYFRGFTSWEKFNETHKTYVSEEVESIVDLFVREAMGLYEWNEYDPDWYPTWLGIKENLNLLESIIETPMQFIHENVIYGRVATEDTPAIEGKIYPALESGMEKVSAGVDSAITGVNLVKQYLPILYQARDLVKLIIADHSAMGMTINFSKIIADNTETKALSLLKTYVNMGMNMGMIPADVVAQYGGIDKVVPMIYATGKAYNDATTDKMTEAIVTLCVVSGQATEERARLGCAILNEYELASGTEYDGSDNFNDDGIIAALKYAMANSTEITVPSVELFGSIVTVTADDIYATYKANSKDAACKELFVRIVSKALEATKNAENSPIATTLEDANEVANALYNIYSVGASSDATDIATPEDFDLVVSSLYPIFGLEPEFADLLVECYTVDHDREDSKKLAIYLMVNQLGLDSEKAAENLGMYEMYHNLPVTFAKLTDTTIHLDLLFALIKQDPNLFGQFEGALIPYYSDFSLDGTAEKFINGELVLDEPDVKNYEDPNQYAIDTVRYKIDSTLMTIYVRFLALNGLFIHPSSVGHEVFAEAIAQYIADFVPNKVDEEGFIFEEGKEYSVLALGDEYLTNVIPDGSNSDIKAYADIVADALGGAVYYPSDSSWTVGETLTFAENNSSNISGYDLILLNAGAWNIGYLAKYINSNGSAPVDLTKLEILEASSDAEGENSIGERLESILGGDSMMQMSKAFMYGYADFAENIEPLVEKLLSTGATVVLVGLDDLMSEGSVINVALSANSQTFSFNLDKLIEKLTNDFNGHMKVLADKYENCYFADISGVSKKLENIVTLGVGVADKMDAMMEETFFDNGEHSLIAERILCDTLGIHAPSGEPTKIVAPTCQTVGELHYSGCELCDEETSRTYVIRYTEKVDHAYNDKADGFIWYDNNESADAIFECIYDCGEETVYQKATVTIEDTATCEKDGIKTFTAVYGEDEAELKEVKTVDSPAKGHAYGEPTWEWTKNEDGVYVNAEATFVCANDEEHVEKVSTEEFSVKVVTEPTCTGVGENEYTATVEFNDKEYSNTNPEYVVVDKIAHAYDKPVWAWSEDYSEATASFECISCDDVQVVEAEIESETTKSTCLEHGETVYTATVVFGDDKKEFTDSITVELELGDHDYVDDICSVCGEKDPDARPDETGDCVYVTEEELDADGVYTMTLGGEEVGEFEFVAVDGGWTISDDGEYLAIENGKLVYSENAFVWTFEDDMFSASETVVEEIKKGFWGGLFGGSNSTEIVETTTTYYLAVVEDELAAGEIGDVAEFSVKHHDDKHSYDEGVVTKPTCTDKGYTTYTCEKCGEECVYNEREKIEHNYVDGECEDCGKLEDVEEPEEPEENCIYIEEVELEEDGSYILSIGGYEVGKYTVTAVDDGWTIFDEKDETYLAVLNGILVYTDEEFVWAYDEEECKFFYEDVKVVTTTNNFWGGLFGGSTSTKTIVNVYYIVPEEDKLVVSEDDELAEVTFEVIVVEEGHDYVDGICENCGKCEDDICVHFDAVELEENGEYVLIIGDEHLGFHTFENVDEDLWTIVNEDGDYVALEDGEIVYTSEEFVWTYDSEKSVFSVEIVTVATSGFWGGLFGGNTSTKVETYYLVAEDGNLAVSLKDKTATAEFLVEVEGEHEYGDLEDYYGLGRSFCENCGTVKFEIAE